MQFKTLGRLVFVISVAVGLVLLGRWQLDKGQLKAQMIVQFEDAQKKPVLSRVYSLDKDMYRRIRVTGRYLEVQFLLDNQTLNGQVGYRLYRIFQTVDGVNVLVDNGWLLAPKRRDQLPEVELSLKRISFEGSVWPWALPSFSLGQGEIEAFDGLYRIQRVDKEQLEKISRRSLADFVVKAYLPESMEPLKPVMSLPPERHYAYAFQWFILAATWLLLWMILFIRRVRRLVSK